MQKQRESKRKGGVLRIEHEKSKLCADVTVVSFQGTLDACDLNRVSEVFDGLIEDKNFYIVADLAELTFISSPAVGLLMGYKRRLVEQNGNLVLVGVTPEMKTKLSMMGADLIFSFHATLRSAINRFHWEYRNRPDVINLAFPADLVYVPAIRRFISQIVLQKGYNRKDGFRIETIVDEICNNAIEHGENVKLGEPIRVQCQVDNEKINFVVLNRTNAEKARQMEQVLQNLDQQPGSADSTRGRGLSLVKKLVKELDVNFTDNGTNVHITKLKEE